MNIKAGIKSPVLWVLLLAFALFIGSVKLLSNEVGNVKTRYCDIEPESTFCKMYPNTKETQ